MKCFTVSTAETLTPRHRYLCLHFQNTCVKTHDLKPFFKTQTPMLKPYVHNLHTGTVLGGAGGAGWGEAPCHRTPVSLPRCGVQEEEPDRGWLDPGLVRSALPLLYGEDLPRAVAEQVSNQCVGLRGLVQPPPYHLPGTLIGCLEVVIGCLSLP